MECAKNPKGIPPQSPGLPSVGQSGSDRGYPGIEASKFYNPNGVAPNWAQSVHGEADFLATPKAPTPSRRRLRFLIPALFILSLAMLSNAIGQPADKPTF